MVIEFSSLILDQNAPASLYQQLYEGVRKMILSGQFKPGSKLPSTRVLAQQLVVSRNTVHLAFEQLIAEGYLEARLGSGTYVAHMLPDDMLNFDQVLGKDNRSDDYANQISSRALELMKLYPDVPMRPQMSEFGFQMTPALDQFPRKIWQRLLIKAWREGGDNLLDFGWGREDLRAAIAEYLGTARGVRCSGDQVILLSGSQQGIELVTRVLLEHQQQVLTEDPGRSLYRATFMAAGAVPVPVPVDNEGMDISYGMKKYPSARLAYVTPSYQFPLGTTMSLRRRIALLEWAKQNQSWILENDYCGEYRYHERPIPALQGLDQEKRTIYLGNFSEVMFPSLRLAYLVVPENLITAFLAARYFSNRQPARLEQAALAYFITGGHFARHIRRMRTVYASRQNALVEAVERELDGKMIISPAKAGMHLLGWLPSGTDDKKVSAKAQAMGLEAPALSSFAIKSSHAPALVLGYTSVNEAALKKGVGKLAQALG